MKTILVSKIIVIVLACLSFNSPVFAQDEDVGERLNKDLAEMVRKYGVLGKTKDTAGLASGDMLVQIHYTKEVPGVGVLPPTTVEEFLEVELDTYNLWKEPYAENMKILSKEMEELKGAQVKGYAIVGSQHPERAKIGVGDKFETRLGGTYEKGRLRIRSRNRIILGAAAVAAGAAWVFGKAALAEEHPKASSAENAEIPYVDPMTVP